MSIGRFDAPDTKALERYRGFLASRIVSLEHDTDAGERAVTSALIRSSADVRTFHALSRLGQSLEGAADGLSLGALKLRDHLPNDVLTG